MGIQPNYSTMETHFAVLDWTNVALLFSVPHCRIFAIYCNTRYAGKRAHALTHMCVYMCVYVCVCVCVCMCIRLLIDAYIYVIYVMYVSLHACVYV